MRNFDFSPLTRSTVGFDRVFDLLDSAFTAAQVDEGYPPFNIVKTGDTSYRIELAVAGFGPGDLSIVAQENVLTVSGSKNASQPAAALSASRHRQPRLRASLQPGGLRQGGEGRSGERAAHHRLGS
jgi:molecular chaperone IbpA